MKVSIRAETPADIEGVRAVNLAAFKQPVEADLIDRLRISSPDFISLVAVNARQVVGNIVFTPATLESGQMPISGMALGPMAVLPAFQRKGIGSTLVQLGMALIRQRSVPFVVVLGHPNFYPRFGFAQSIAYGIECPWPGIPKEVFMATILDEKLMAGRKGLVRYRPEFDSAL
ncbi:MAG: N-acetyltransferase [candidate division Zixibacteria bacterium]|nr:N-acetyltransferase [candidate division Zixibacteria bacterium]